MTSSSFLDYWFGSGNQLNVLQMSCRGVVIFILALIMIRIAGRRSFGLRTPVDNIISILLGAVLSRAVAGSSPFLPVVVSCFVVVCLHRAIGWLIAHNKAFSKLIEGNKILLYEKGEFLSDHMRRVQIGKEDVMQGLRRQALTEDLNEIERVYIERNGEISAIRKKSQQ